MANPTKEIQKAAHSIAMAVGFTGESWEGHA